MKRNSKIDVINNISSENVVLTGIHNNHNTSGSSDHSSVINCVFHNVSFSVKEKKHVFCKTSEKIILVTVSGVFRIGMNAILGPTGSGKSSLLDVIAGRKNPKGVTGNVFINGSRQSKNFKCVSGYVVQDDIIMGTLTVRENLRFSAALRLPETVSRVEQELLVEDLLDELGLKHVADSPVGSEVTRGISGGERKRCCIGMELILSPNFLFLDEPTTGLDATTALSVMKLLKTLSLNRVVVFSIHQPRYSILKLFDNTTLMCNGEVVYHGPQTDIIPYFAQMGYVCETYNNPMDFVMDVVNGDIESEENTNNNRTEVKTQKTNLVTFYKNSDYYKKS